LNGPALRNLALGDLLVIIVFAAVEVPVVAAVAVQESLL
jgi:hypothetical protein